MRTKRQQLYEKLYYGFALNLYGAFDNHRQRKAMRGVKYDEDFKRYYRDTVLPYWKRFGIRPKRHWVMLHYLRGYRDPRYIPEDIYHCCIVPHFNEHVYARPLEDKNMYHLLFPDIKRPETVFKFIHGGFAEDDLIPISREEAYGRLARPERFILKPTRDTGKGSGISFFDGPLDKKAADELFEKYNGQEFIVQKLHRQHPDLAVLNTSSVNTIRLETLVFHGQAYLLSAILRVGHKGSRVDNVSKGGYQAVIRPDGTLEKTAYTHQGGVEAFVEQNEDGVLFSNTPPIPSWERLKATALDLALKLPHLKFIGWDFSVDEAGDPVLIEFNAQHANNQENCGPTFGDMTEEVLSEVFPKKKR